MRTAWIVIGMALGASILMGQGQDQSAGKARTPTPTLRLRIYPDAMYPSVLRVPPGEYYIRIDNFATTGAIPIQIDNTQENRSLQRLVNGNLNAKQARWNQTLQLSRGEYVIDAARHPSWKARILVDPSYVLPTVR